MCLLGLVCAFASLPWFDLRFLHFGCPACATALIACECVIGPMSEFDSDTDLLLSQMSYDSGSSSDSDMADFKPDRKPRFKKPVPQDEVDKVQKSGKAKNTVKDTKWSVNVYKEWRSSRNSYVIGQKPGKTGAYTLVPLLNSETPSKELDFWMCRFVLEVNRQDGTPYPATTLKHLCAGIQRYMRDVKI